MDRVLVGTAGHIDHGKSALVRALTGTDPDRLPEEKARGITIDLGFAHAAWDGTVFSFVDVPGHEKFVRTMVAGATGIDVALLCVASDDSVMPQTREHLAILGLLGVAHGVIARTKSDLVDEEIGKVVEEEVRALAAGTFLEPAPLVAVSSVTGAGLAGLRAALSAAARRTRRRDPSERPARLFVDRAFTMKGFGPVVTGTLDGGRLSPEERLVLLPGGREARVRRVEVHGEERPAAEAGERTSLNLTGVERADMERGLALVAPGSLEATSLLTVELALLPGLDAPLADGTPLRLHLGTADVAARLRLLPVGAVPAPASLPPGGKAIVQLSLREGLAARRGDRYVVRRPSPQETLGGGRVLDGTRERVRRRAPLSDAAAKVLSQGSERDVAALFVEESRERALDAASLARRLGVPLAAAAAHLDALVFAGAALRIAPGLVATAKALTELSVRAGEVFAQRRKAGAPTLLMSRSELLSRIGGGLDAAVAEAWLTTLAAAGKVVLSGDQAGPPGAASGAVAAEAGGFAERIETAYRDGGFDVPRSVDLAKKVGTKPQVVEGLVQHLLKSGALVRLSPDLVVHASALSAVEAKLDPLKGRTMSVADFRDLLGLSRKYLIPLLEHLDRRRRTRRVGDARVVE